MRHRPSFLAHAGRVVRLVALTAVVIPVFVLAGLGFAPVVGGRRPQLLRWYLQTAGAGFVKVGQVLAMRFDLLPQAYCTELSRLLDDLPPDDLPTFLAELERGLGKPVSTAFASVDARPLGSASLAQVHRAVLHDGSEVAVKVLRPGIASRLASDMRSFRMLAWLLDLTGLFLPIRLRSLAHEVDLLTREELDFRREARNAHLLQQLMAGDGVDHCSPKVHWEHTTASVITMELFRGVWCRDLLAAVERRDIAALEEYRRWGITPRRAARLIFRSIMEQAYRHRVFHADPHAGNMVFLEGGRLGFIDFGMIGWLDERQWSLQYRLFENIASERLHAAYGAMLDTLEPLNVRDLQPFEAEFKALLWDWMLAARNPSSSVEEKSTGRFLWRATLAMRSAGLRPPWTLMRLHRTTITADMAELKLHPSFDVVEEMRLFFRDDAARAALAVPDADEVELAMALQLRRLRESPAVARNIVDFFEFRLPVVARSYGDTLTRFERAINVALRYARTISLVIAAAALVSLWWMPSGLGSASDGRPARFAVGAILGLVGWALTKMIRLYDEPG